MSNGAKEKIIYALGKLLQMAVVMVLLSVIVFVIARLCPGDPLRSYYGDGIEHMSEEQKDAARESLGLNDSMAVQYGRWAESLFRGDLGISYKYKRPVTEVMGRVWMNTLLLGGISYVLTFAFAIALGKFCAIREGSRADRIICKAGVVSGSVPSFFMALILILIFAVNLKLLPAGGAYSYGNGANIADRLLHLVLPVSVMVLEHLWYYAYLIRNKLVEEAREDYVMLCKAEGLSGKRVLEKHCFRNVMPSLLVVMAIAVPHVLGGTYVVETIFSYPGLGTLSFESAMYQDYNMLMALCLLTGGLVLFFNFIAQLLNEFIDPRMKHTAVIREEAA